MKLARVDHYRCNEPAGKWGLSSYVWISGEMTEQEFEALCEAARAQYMEAEGILKASAPVPAPGYGATILPQTPDNMTVGELKAEYATKAQAYKDYQAKCASARKPFTDHLVAVSEGRISKFFDVEPYIVSKLSWGHNHGTTIEYGETKLQDYPATDEEEL